MDGGCIVAAPPCSCRDALVLCMYLPGKLHRSKYCNNSQVFMCGSAAPCIDDQQEITSRATLPSIVCVSPTGSRRTWLPASDARVFLIFPGASHCCDPQHDRSGCHSAGHVGGDVLPYIARAATTVENVCYGPDDATRVRMPHE